MPMEPDREQPPTEVERLRAVIESSRPKHCGVCGGTLRVIACIETPPEVPLAARTHSLIETILTHLAARETGGINHPRAPPLYPPLTQPPDSPSPALS